MNGIKQQLNKNSNKLFRYLVIALLFTSCSATNQLTMGVVEPAPVSVSKTVTNIGIINRSLPSESNQSIDKIDQILSAEGLNLDKKGGAAAISSLADRLRKNETFNIVKILDGGLDLQKGLGVFPATIDWDVIESLCEKNEVDVIFSLAFYDTDTKVSYKVTTMEVPNNLGIKVAVPAQELSLQTLIKNGWRIYDLKSKQVVDKYTYQKTVSSTGRGINPVKAFEAIMGRNEAVLQQSKNIGSSYGLRLLPIKRRVTRNYFVKGTDNFELGKRRAQTGNWQGAAELWEQELSNTDQKIAGRANYNMAIINEINGDLEKAINYASRSYTDYQNKDALRYLKTLEYRLSQIAKLRQQASR